MSQANDHKKNSEKQIQWGQNLKLAIAKNIILRQFVTIWSIPKS